MKIFTAILLMAATACGLPPELAPPMAIGQTCSGQGFSLQLEQGSTMACADVAQTLSAERAAYETRWGPVNMGGRVVRILARPYLSVDYVRDTAIGGATYEDAIVLGSSMIEAFPHELHHVQLGPDASADHHGWCQDFVPWEAQELGFQDIGLSCPLSAYGVQP